MTQSKPTVTIDQTFQALLADQEARLSLEVRLVQGGLGNWRDGGENAERLASGRGET